MTLRQILLHHECISRISRRSRIDRIVDVSHAQAGGKAAKELISKLEKD